MATTEKVRAQRRREILQNKEINCILNWGKKAKADLILQLKSLLAKEELVSRDVLNLESQV